MRWLAKWTALRGVNRAVKKAFEATTKAGEMADGAHDALVLAGVEPHPIAGKTFAKEFTTKYGDRAESALRQLRESAEDTRFLDEAVGQAVRDLADPKLPVPTRPFAASAHPSSRRPHLRS